MPTQNLLVELFVEELPPKALNKLGDAFAASLAEGLRTQGLADAASVVTPFASPRRLAVHVTAVQAQAEDKAVTHKLMPAGVGLNAQGEATPALLKKLAALGLGAAAVAQLQRRPDGKSEALFIDTVVPGVVLADGLQKALDAALQSLPIPKLMQYQLADGWTNVQFVRPAHGLVALHGADVVPVGALGLQAGRDTHGHRFEAALDPLPLHEADHYARDLAEKGAVIASFAARRDEIAHQLKAAADEQGLTPIDDAALLDEVTALVERPNVLLCHFDAEFLVVPPECLILTMKANQKYFPLLDAQAKLTNKFLVVGNIRPADPSRVIGGNERVVRPRLADAKFFFDQDRKKSLAERVEGLKKVVYLNKLGAAGDMHSRMLRISRLARDIGEQLGDAAVAAHAERAAVLAKCDLLTDMVGEFPELQGIMGGYYARHDGEAEAVALAVEDHYKPRFAGDALPRETAGIVVALADKLDTLVALFGVGQVPTGDKDPFALRRHALGVIRMLMEQRLPLPVHGLVEQAFWRLQEQMGTPHALSPSTVAEVEAFVFERLAGSLREQGYSAQEVDAVLALRPPALGDIAARLAAVRVFAALPEAPSLAAANKRVGNILRKSDAAEGAFSPALLVEPAEIALHAALGDVGRAAREQLALGDYTRSLRELAALRGPVDGFFGAVMVNAPDAALRHNRLWLLQDLHAEMNRVADLSRLAS